MRIKLLSATLIVLAAPSLLAFEIKPVCPSLRGAYCSEANTDKIEFRAPSEDCANDEKMYALKGLNQPIHEALTRQAHYEVTGKRLTSLNYLTPILSGVE